MSDDFRSDGGILRTHADNASPNGAGSWRGLDRLLQVQGLAPMEQRRKSSDIMRWPSSDVKRHDMDQTVPTGGQLPAADTDQILPDATRLVGALRHIGYSIEQAVSDLVDNSIDAQAGTILIRFVYDDEAVRTVAIVDDGKGMTASRLTEAMRFGSVDDDTPKTESLGKYGLGLKLASISQARTLTVLTRKGGRDSGRRWNVESMGHDWSNDRLENTAAKALLDHEWGEVDLSSSGTIVLWDDIDKIKHSSRGVDATIDNLVARLELHLGLVFHRFVEDGRLRILTDRQHADEDRPAGLSEIRALNPFGYEQSGDASYPAKLQTAIPGVGRVRMEAHVWPPNARQKEYSLGRRAAARQGFYFYRNDRLIQAGGWNGVVKNEAEPHSSLARVRIDLPSSMDADFGLNVQKSTVLVPHGFADAVKDAEGAGRSFRDYREAAQQVYRKKSKKAERALPCRPNEGLPRYLVDRAKKLLAPGRKASQAISFRWKHFESGDLFEVARDERCIYLNKSLRRKLLGGKRASQNDLPLIKLLVFFLVHEDFNSGRRTAQRKKELDLINALLSECTRKMQG